MTKHKKIETKTLKYFKRITYDTGRITLRLRRTKVIVAFFVPSKNQWFTHNDTLAKLTDDELVELLYLTSETQ